MINGRAILVFLHDLGAVAVAWLAAYWLRFNFEIPAEFSAAMWAALPIVALVHGVSFYLFGLYRGLWRFASVPDLKRILFACGMGAVATPLALVMLQQWHLVPRSVIVLMPLLLVILMGGVRFGYRAWKDGQLFLARTGVGEPVIVLGAGEAAASLLREIGRNPAWRVVGLLDDDAQMAGRQLGGVSILGPLDAVAGIAKRAEVKQAIIAMPSAAASARRRAAELAAAAGLTVLTVPNVDELISGRVSISSLRKVELEDLLGRERIQLDEEGLHRLLTGRVVLVTGAGGSIGSELCRQIARFEPSRLVFFEASEFALYSIHSEFSTTHPAQAVECVVGDVKDGVRLDEVFARWRPDVVFHAAAYKHVPLMEQGNAWQAVQNNVLGTRCVAQAAITHGVERFVMVSTDKAVNPTNVMGASKRLAEQVCQALQRTPGHGTHFVTVRFGNVLGSSGSVIPRFREQIARGGPVTVTHPDIIRYFMLIPEAAQLVLQAGWMGRGGEIFVLDMGEPVKIVDLARDMIRLSGFSDDEIAIEFTGLRPGEKLFEELLADDELTLPTPHQKLRIARSSEAPDAQWLLRLDDWLEAAGKPEAEVKQGLRQWVPEYVPT
jgi:FlaA1/EpsC-like NDP-sugar epimerase